MQVRPFFHVIVAFTELLVIDYRSIDDALTSAASNSTAVSSATLADSKRSADAAGLVSIDSTSRKRVKTVNDDTRASSLGTVQLPVPRKGNLQDMNLSDSENQRASYVLEVLSYSGWRSHALGLRVTDKQITLLYYDHSIIVESKPFDFFASPLRFISLVRGLARFSQDDRGFHPSIIREERHLKSIPHTLENSEQRASDLASETYLGLRVKLRNGVVLKVKETIHIQHCLIGRGTCVLRVEQVDHKPGVPDLGENLVMKLSWPKATQTSEEYVVRMATEKAKELDDTWVLDHLPDIVYSENYMAGSVLDSVQTRLARALGGEYKKREMRIIVERELKPIKSLKGCLATYNVFYDVFRCEFILLHYASS